MRIDVGAETGTASPIFHVRAECPADRAFLAIFIKAGFMDSTKELTVGNVGYVSYCEEPQEFCFGWRPRPEQPKKAKGKRRK